MKEEEKVKESVKFIRRESRGTPALGLVLGSGLGNFADLLLERRAIDTATIPHYPRSTVEGHKGRIVFGRLGKVELCVLQGRVHFYESGSLDAVLYPIRVLRALGVTTLIVTNAAGGVNPGFRPGDLMLITDQINLTFGLPLPPGGGRARPSAGVLYDPKLIALVRKTAAAKGILLQSGVYCGVKGPSYETAAEVRMVGRIGGDAVGMSTVNEVSFAASLGMRVAGVSCITNLATGTGAAALSHAEVTEVADRVQHSFTALLEGAIEAIAVTSRRGSSGRNP